MSRVPYVSTMGSLMYIIICVRPNNPQAMREINRFMKKSTSNERN